MTHLPGTVHLVAKAPELDIQRLLCAVCDAHVAELASAGMIGILHDIPGIFGSPGTQIDGVHDFRIRFFCPVGKFMQADRIRFSREPRKVQPAGTIRSHTVLPVETRDKIAAGIAHDRNAELSHHIQHIPPKALLISHRVAGLIDAAVHGTAEVLNK